MILIVIYLFYLIIIINIIMYYLPTLSCITFQRYNLQLYLILY